MMTYSHQHCDGSVIALPVGKVVCIGQNYQDHIAEMQSKTAAEPLFFIKPSTALCPLVPSFAIPANRGAVHNELEIAVLIAKPLSQASTEQVAAAIWGYSLALDLTLRDVQSSLKQLGRPWELAKGFDGACPVAGFVPAATLAHPQQLDFSLNVNGIERQHGNSATMIRGISQLISEMSQHFTLLPGDMVLTGTPAGVGPLHIGDQLQIQMADYFTVTTKVS
ncbi:fumarylacetoacetate hydrolase family protein [Arsukibacterium sp. MJ3]|jgi:2-keto-4-pentenoate hydratase/2-oxohepta-3-ene-1,7-dioic acid hydratase in catechol pathway|uniref:fumarylacetoacetate hydrolase family protein n=1 Tax=Arsukibacterium sp. MJ3 TaxID=1632859 RepID=UPI000ADDB675|nr:fumarylacetoacetate hydrolase family protein [Arsukibacterium sp. MJ3]